MTERTKRLDHLLREEISAIITRQVSDPRIGFVTVTGVDVAPDLTHATVWVSVIGSDEDRRGTMRALGRAMPFVRRQLGGLHLRRIPELHVREDDSAVRGTRVMRIIDELEEAERAAGGAGSAGGAPEPPPLEALPTPGPARSTRSGAPGRQGAPGRPGARWLGPRPVRSALRTRHGHGR